MLNTVSFFRVLNFVLLALATVLLLLTFLFMPSFTFQGNAQEYVQKIENTTDLETAKRVSISYLKIYASANRSANGIVTFLMLALLCAVPIFLGNYVLAGKIEKKLAGANN